MTNIVWLLEEMLTAIHHRQIAEHGGSEGVRDEGLLSSALARPQNLFAYGEPTPDLASLAAAYAYGIARNHPFIDGNKRTGFMLAATFLEINGLQFTASEESVVEATVALAAGAMTEAGYADWLKANSRKPRKR